MTTSTQPDTDAEFDFYADTAARIGQSRLVLAPCIDGTPKFDADLAAFDAAPDGGLAAGDLDRLCILTEDFHIITRGEIDNASVRAISRFDGREIVTTQIAGPPDLAGQAADFILTTHSRPAGKRLVAANDNKAQWPGIISSGALISRFTPPDYAIDGIVRSGFLYSVTASTGTGKTAILLLMSALTALGKPLGNREVRKGRVVYFAGENPDDVTMRWIGAAHHMGFDPDEIDVNFVPGVFDITKMFTEVARAVRRIGGADLVVIDTSAAYFQGADENANVDMARHARNLRALTTLPGSPCVLVACHPTKSADQTNLLPRGGGAFLAEVDGNLVCMRTADGAVKMHWQGKHRGPDFEPVLFDLNTVTAPGLKDSRGRDIPTVLASVVSDGEAIARKVSARRDEDEVLILIEEDGALSTAAMAGKLGWLKGGVPHKRRVQTAVTKLKIDGLVAFTPRKGWALTKAGREAVSDARHERFHAGLAEQTASAIIANAIADMD